MKKDSLFTSDRCAGFATKLKGGCKMFRGSLINRLTRCVALLVLVAAIGHLTAAGVEVHAAPPSSHQDILNSVGAVQTTVNSIDTNVNAVQTTVNSIDSKLDQIPPAWSQIIPLASDRFSSVLGGAGVRDRETGLVWEQSPSTETFVWYFALSHCYMLEVGGRKGWRLQTIEELASLVDTSNSFPALPTGHPFTLTSEQADGGYWSATTSTLGSPDSSIPHAWVVLLGPGLVDHGGKTNGGLAWCVRGGQGIDGVQ